MDSDYQRRFWDSEISRAKVNCRSNFWKAVSDIKFKLTPSQIKKFEDSCFGHFLKANEIQFSGHIVNSMLYRQCVCDDKNSMVFNFGGRGARFTRRDFTIITGLRFGYEPNRRVNISTRISDTYFGGKRKVTNSEIIEAFMTSQCQDDDEADDDRLKLALLYILEMVLLGKESMATAPHNHLEMVDDLEYFNNYPWGTLSYTTTIRSLKSAFEHRESMVLNKSKSYSLCGFPLAFMIWGFETIPSLSQAFGKKLPDMVFPRILNWCISQVPRFEKATELFDHRDYPVHGLMNITEFECAYIGKIAWDVRHDSTPYNVAPAV